nr:uncharacterized protein LOC113733851 [Coffea arabica]
MRVEGVHSLWTCHCQRYQPTGCPQISPPPPYKAQLLTRSTTTTTTTKRPFAFLLPHPRSLSLSSIFSAVASSCMGGREKVAKQKATLKIPRGDFFPINLYGSTNARARMPNLVKGAMRGQQQIFLTWSSQLEMDACSSPTSSILTVAPSF